MMIYWHDHKATLTGKHHYLVPGVITTQIRFTGASASVAVARVKHRGFTINVSKLLKGS